MKRSEEQPKVELEDELDTLFKLPLADFVDTRNQLTARLKKGGRGDEAALVKALVKPPISAWAVNQLYWNHRAAFDGLVSSGERFHKAQTSGKIADMRVALDVRREALTHLSDLATSLLQDAGHNPSLDTIRRITTTLEALSVSSSGFEAPTLGRLTQDVDPPGFGSLASFVPAAGKSKEPPRLKAAEKTSTAAAKRSRVSIPKKGAPKIAEQRRADIAAAKASVQEARRALTKLQARAERLEAAQKHADADFKKAERRKRDAEKSLELATAAFQYADQRARSVVAELEEVTNALEEAERMVEKATKEFETFSRE